jgi:hypothetical protein
MSFGGGDLPQPLPLQLAELGTPGNEIFRSVADAMLSDTLILASIFRLASDRLFFFGALGPTGQEATHNFVILSIANAFSFTSVTGFNQSFDIIQYLGFTDRFFAPDIIQELFGPLGAGNKVAEATVIDAVNTFSFNLHDSPYNEALGRAYNVSNTLTGTESLIILVNLDAENEFGFSNVVDAASSTYTRPATHSVIRQSLTYHITGSDCPAEKTYSPFVGDTPDPNFGTMSETPPTLGAGTMRFELASPSTILTLKNPEFQNTDDLQFTRIDRKTRGGDRKLYSDQDWGTVQTLRLRVEKLCAVDADMVIDFLNISNGLEVSLFDWEGRQWDGLILNSDTDVFTDENETTTFDIVFEGSVV